MGYFATSGRYFAPQLAISILEHWKGALLHFDCHVVTFLRICKFLDFADFRVYLHVLSLALFTWINRAEKLFFESGGSGDDTFVLELDNRRPSEANKVVK
jgi:hypothetical protein